ncbi:MAG: hypothetical protein KAI97_02140, partial [Gemmatimonadetes bacterium]|nr:hypothetical protein [Gemmatimonadota bacterium]
MRTLFAAFAMATAIVLVGCQDDDALLPSSPSRSLDTAVDDDALCDLASMIFDGGRLNAVCKQLRNIERQADRGETVDAAEKALDLIEFVLGHFNGGRLSDPPGAATTEEVLGQLIAGIAELGGLLPAGSDPIPPGAFTPEGAVEMCTASAGCTVTTGTEFAGTMIPAGTPLVDVNTGEPVDHVIVVINRESDTLFPFSSFGFDDFPLFYNITTIPEVEILSNGGLNGAQEDEMVVGVCVVDPPDPLAPPEGADLRIARLFDGGEGQEVEITPLRDASFLDCTGASTNGEALTGWRGWLASIFGPASSVLDVTPLYANPGRLGGAISAFSMYGAVDVSAPEPNGTIRISGFDINRGRGPLVGGGTGSLSAATLVAGLSDPDNFGAEGTVACEIDIQDLVTTIAPASLVDGQGNLLVDFFFAGLTTTSLTTAEATELADFLNAGGIVYLSGNSGGNEGPSYNPLFAELDVADQYTGVVIQQNGPSSIPLGTPVTNGPFGVVGPLSHSHFRALDPSESTAVASTAETPIVAELFVGDTGYLSWMGDPLYFNLFTDADTDNLTYFLNLFALGCSDGGE